MEDLSLTVRTFNSSVAITKQAGTASPQLSKASKSQTSVVNTLESETSSFGSGAQGRNSSIEISATEVQKAVDKLNSQLEGSARSIRFQINDTTDKIEVFVVDKETGEVVGKIPPEASIRVASNGELGGLFNIQG
jgi:uncharacterized FlaG/YvyC family protein